MKKLVAMLLCLAMLLSLTAFAAAEEKTTVVFWYSLEGTNAECIKQIVDDFNKSQDKIFVDAQYQGAYDDAINKLKAAGMGQLPCDIVHSYEIGTRFIIDSGWIVPVQEYIDKDNWDTSAIEPNLLAYYTVDGKINSMPFNCSTPLMYYNKTAFDEAGITEIPTTVDEWYEVLKAFKEQDANGNGDPNDEIPLTGSAKKDLFDWIRYINPWGLVDSIQENFLALDQETLKPVFIPADERYKEAVAFFHKLYAEGIMDPEFITQDGSMSDAKWKNADVSLVGTGIAWETSSATQPHSDEYVPMLPLAGPNGDRYIRGNDEIIIYHRNEYTITTACEHPEVAMRWADYFSTDDISVQSYWGPYGVALNKDEDGNITFLDPPEGKNGDQWYWEICPRDYGPKYVTPEFEAKITLPENSGDGAKLKEDEMMKEFVAKPYPVVNYTAEQSEEISSLTVDIYKYVNETWASWIVNGGIDEQWDAYVDQLNQMGLERLMEIYQEALDVYNNAG